MDFGRIDESIKSPSPQEKCSTVAGKYSTPPGKCPSPRTGLTKIYNPFGHQHLHDSPYMSVFSPNAFATPNTTDKSKFRWTIDNVSKLRPADIDENTDSHHVDVDDVDPATEVLIQSKISRYFSETVIVPSPLTELKRTSLAAVTEERGAAKKMVDTSTQTALSLPFDLPANLLAVLTPYFSHGESPAPVGDSPFDQKLFNESVETSPAMSTGFSPINFSPMPDRFRPFDRASDDRALPEWQLSPIPLDSLARSACRLDFSTDEMSVDATRKSPDLAADGSLQPLNGSAANWDMEFEYVSFISPPTSPNAMMDVTQLSTPHTRLFTGQRKRLSDSFQDLEENDENKENEPPGQVFASTPSRSGRY